jgi:hypothetical protein
MVITILYLNNKTVSHAYMMHVKLAQIKHPAKPVLVIKIKTIHAFCLTALVRLATTQTPLINQIVQVSSLFYTISLFHLSLILA